MSKRRVLLIHNILWSHYKATVFSELAVACTAAGVDFFVLQTALYGSGQKSLSDVDLSIHRYPYKLLFERSMEDTTLRERFAAYRREIRAFAPDVVVLPGYIDPVVWLLTPYLVSQGVKLIQVVDSTLHDHRRTWWKEKIKQVILSPAQLVFCYGTAARDYLLRLGVPERRIRIRIQATNNALFTDSYQRLVERAGVKRAGGRFTVLYVGRLSPEKNLATLLRSFSTLAEEYELHLVGAGPQDAELRTMAGELDIADRVSFFGSRPWDELIEFYARANVLVLPSWSETWGLVVNEAMLCHLPVVVSERCGAAPDLVVEGVNGFTFSPESADELSAKIRETARLIGEGKAMGDHSAEIIAQFAPEKAARQMLNGFEEVLRG